MIRPKKGQAIVEFIFIISLMIPVVAGFLAFGRALTVRLKAQSVARYGTRLQDTGLLQESVIRAELHQYGSHLFPKNASSYRWEIGRFLGTSSSRFYNLCITKVQIDFRSAFFDRLNIDEVSEVQETVVAQKAL